MILLVNSLLLQPPRMFGLEFKKSHIQDLAYLHRNLVLSKSFIKTLFKTRGLTSHPGHRRKLGNVLENVCIYFKDNNNFTEGDNFDEEVAEKMSLYFELILENIWDWFDDSVDYVCDNIECIPSREPPKKKKLVFDQRQL